MTSAPLASQSDAMKKDSALFKDDDNNDWQVKILERLQKSAVPEPIKVACVTPPPGKPSYLGEAYHGIISREEETRLLENKSGRYLVRESFSNPRLNEYTLAFNFDGEINRVRLCYSPTSQSYKTNRSEKDYKSIVELITDILGLYQRLRSQEYAITKKEKYQKPHVFKVHFYKHPKWCDHCCKFLWGIYKQGYKCQDCDMNVHKECQNNAPLPCSKVYVVRKFSKESKDSHMKIENKNSNVESINNNPNQDYVEIFRINEVSGHCKYFRQCSRFLSAFKIRDKYVDINHSLTRCFCDECVAEKETNQHNNNTLMCNTFKQWTRFHFSEKEDPLKENLRNWDIVYFAIQPKLIENMIKDCYAKNESNFDSQDLIVAPSLAYTALDMENENWSYKFKDTQTADNLFAQTVLEVYLRPNSYVISPTFSEYNSKCAKNIVPEHWKVKALSDIYPKSVLVKIFKEI